MKKSYDVTAICNALVDILIEAKDQDISDLSLTKGIMHLVDSKRQREVLRRVRHSSEVIELGGSAMNAIRVLASLGKNTAFIGMVGNDDFGDRIRQRMESLGVAAKLKASDQPTGSCVILVTPDGERTMNTDLGASCLYDEAIVDEQEIMDSHVFHFCGYQWATDGQKRAIGKALEAAKTSGTKVSFDLADPFVVQNSRDDLWRIIEHHADIVFANRDEARLLCDGAAETVAAKIAATGAIAAIKLGAEGCLIHQGSRCFRIPAVPTSVKDTTAAGDVFAAGFLYGYTSGVDLETCGRMATLLASDVISRYGAIVSDQALAAARRMIP